VWAVEDCRHVSGRLERGLLASGDRVLRVAPGLTETSRRAVRQPGRSDPIDATAIARAALREGLDTLPAAHLDEQALEIRTPNDYRDQIVCQRSRLACRLRWQLVQLAPDLETKIAPASLDHPQVRERVARRLARLPRTAQVRVAKLTLKRIGQITVQERELRVEITALIEAHCPARLAEHGCGPITAAIIIGHTAGAQRFPTDACFARHAGTAPIPASSGNTRRRRLHRGGNRQLNRAIHIIAFSVPAPTRPPAPTSTANTPKARASAKRSAASNATSPAALGGFSTRLPQHLTNDPSTRTAPSRAALPPSCRAPGESSQIAIHP
jgi:transposase